MLTMEIFRFNILPMSDTEKHEAFKEAVNTCPSCQQNLMFQHELDFNTNTLCEQAYCEHCQMQVREESFNLQ